MKALTAALFEPRWAGGWTLSRILFVFACLRTHGMRFVGIGDAYGAPDMIFTNAVWKFADYITLSEPQTWAVWALGMVGIGLVAFGRGWWFRGGIVLWFVASWTLIGYEALNVKAYDRLLTWIGFALLISPAADKINMTNSYRGSVARWVMTLAMCSIYGSTGLFKALKEPAWQTGEVLAFHMLEPWHGGIALGVYLSNFPMLMMLMAWATVAFEALFPLLIWFKRINPWLLLVGVMFHLGLFFMMHIPAFFYVSLAAYPVMLHPETAERIYCKCAGLFTAAKP